MSEDLLVILHRRLSGFVRTFGLRPIAKAVFRGLLRLRYGNFGLTRARQNGRVWRLDFDVARRGLEQEMGTILWLRRVLRQGDTVLDLGANVGQMTLEMAELVGPTGRVIAVEPAPGNLRLLRRHVEANGYEDRVQIVEAACVERDGVNAILGVVSDVGEADTVGSGHAVLSARSIPPAGQTVELEVSGVSVDALVARAGVSPRAIKIDVEGSELRVLQGAGETLAVHRPLLRFGFHPFAFENPSAASYQISSLLRGHGYSVDLGVADTMSLGEYECTPE